MEIAIESPANQEVAIFLESHLAHMREVTPVGSVHALGSDELSGNEITLWTAREGEALLGCGALKSLGGGFGEIKAMRTAEQHRGKGVGTALLNHIISVATEREYTRLWLETGAGEPFRPARWIYERRGFELSGPFGDYRADPNSVFMALALND